MTRKRAIVIPPEMVKPLRIIEFTEGTLLRQLYAEIGCDCVSSSPRLVTPLGRMYMWVDDVGLLHDEVVHNDRAIAACRGVGYMIPDVAGVAVFTGGADEAGNTLGLGEALIDEFAHAFGEPERLVTECPTCGARYRTSGASLVDGDTGRLVRCPDGWHGPGTGPVTVTVDIGGADTQLDAVRARMADADAEREAEQAFEYDGDR